MQTLTPSQRPKRRYRLITPAVIRQYELAKIQTGNGTAATRLIDPDVKDPHRRSLLIALKARQLNATEYIDHTMQQIGVEAVERVKQLVQSSDEKIATKNAHFVIDHVRGKALQRSESKTLSVNIEAVLH